MLIIGRRNGRREREKNGLHAEAAPFLHVWGTRTSSVQISLLLHKRFEDSEKYQYFSNNTLAFYNYCMSIFN